MTGSIIGEYPERLLLIASYPMGTQMCSLSSHADVTEKICLSFDNLLMPLNEFIPQTESKIMKLKISIKIRLNSSCRMAVDEFSMLLLMRVK